MRRWLLGSLAASLLAGTALSGAAMAADVVTVTNPTNGCKTTVYGPDVTSNGDVDPLRAYSIQGGAGESVSC